MPDPLLCEDTAQEAGDHRTYNTHATPDGDLPSENTEPNLPESVSATTSAEDETAVANAEAADAIRLARLQQLFADNPGNNEIASSSDRRPLLEACLANNVLSVQFLLQQHGASWNLPGELTAALQFASDSYIAAPRSSEKLRARWLRMIAVLLDAGADPNITAGRQDRPILWYLAGRPYYFELASLLLDHKANPNTAHGDLPVLYLALRISDDRLANALVAHGADINATFPFKPFSDLRMPDRVALVHCVATGLWCGFKYPGRVLEFLLTHGANPNQRDAEGRTALYYAAYYDNADAIRVLLAHGADPSIRNNNGRLPVMVVHDLDLARILAQHTDQITSEDIRDALEHASYSAIPGLYHQLHGSWTPLWLIAWTLLVGATLAHIVRRHHRANATPKSRGRKTRDVDTSVEPQSAHSKIAGTATAKFSAFAAKDDLQWSSAPEVPPTGKRASLGGAAKLQAKLERLRTRFLQLRPLALVPLTAWSIAWALFFFDPYLRAQGLPWNLAMLGGGIILAGLMAPLFGDSERGRIWISLCGMVCAVAAAAGCGYVCRAFWRIDEFWMAVVFAGTAATALFASGLFWQAFSLHWLIHKLQRKYQKPKLSDADDLDAPAGWDQA